MNHIHALVTIGALAANPLPAQVTWSLLSGAAAPAPFAAGCWDAGRQRFVAFGGQLGSNEVATTWEWNGSNWLVATPSTRPTARTHAAMTFEEFGGRCLLFGGGTAFRNDTWAWNGTTWSQLTPTNAPSPRNGTAMAFDRLRQVVVLFGGFTASGDNAETWEWNGSDWLLRTPVGAAPSARGGHRLVYHDGLGRTLLAGGYDSNAQTTLADTWTYDGTAWQPEASLPGSVRDHAMTYDRDRQRVVAAGGRRILLGSTFDLDEVHEWDGAAWLTRGPLQVPASRHASVAAFNPTTSSMIIAGGIDTNGAAKFDTWRYRTVQPALATAFGQACATSTGPIRQQPFRMPYVGLAFELDVIDATPFTNVGIVAFGVSNTSWNGTQLPLSLAGIGGGSCELQVSFDVPQPILLVNGKGRASWQLPNAPQLVGAEFYTQALSFWNGGPIPFDSSAGLRFTIGNP